MASLKTFIGDAKDFVTRITGLTPWTAPPAINLETTSAQVMAITGKDANGTPPAISLETTSTQIKAITGQAANHTAPAISLATTKTHVDTTPTTGTAHGITGWDTAPVALGASASAGNATTISRSNHVHPYPSAANVGAMATSHAANGITGWDTAPVALGASASAGNASTISRSNHVHPYPSAADVGAMATSHAANAITGFATTATALAASQSPGNSSTVSRGNHVHPLPSLAALGAAALAGSASQAFAASTLTVDKVVADVGTAGGMFSPSTLAVIGFGSTWSSAAVYADAGLYVKNYANSAYTTVNASAFTVWSDERLKRGIRPLRAGSGLGALAALAKRGVIHYRLKDEPDSAPERLGFSAQQVAAAMPEIGRVLEPLDEEEPLLGWEVGAMLALVVDAVGALAERLDALERGRP